MRDWMDRQVIVSSFPTSPPFSDQQPGNTALVLLFTISRVDYYSEASQAQYHSSSSC